MGGGRDSKVNVKLLVVKEKRKTVEYHVDVAKKYVAHEDLSITRAGNCAKNDISESPKVALWAESTCPTRFGQPWAPGEFPEAVPQT